MSEPNRCQAQNQSGEPCGATHYRDGWCRWHHPDPEMREKHRAISARGGKERSNTNRARRKLAGDLRDLVGVKATLLEAMEEVRNGDMDPEIGRSLATLARAVVVVAGVADFEQELVRMREDMARFIERQDATG